MLRAPAPSPATRLQCIARPAAIGLGLGRPRRARGGRAPAPLIRPHPDSSLLIPAAAPDNGAAAVTARAPSGASERAADGAPSTAHAPAAAPFDYERQWWPVHDLDSIDASRPHALELLGKKLVLWRDGDGAWRCMEDACPHRLAPLSEGRVDGGQLECSYHGWRFGGDGRCTRIPQSVDAKAEATACASSRSCVKSYPVREEAGILFVWGHAGSPDAAAAAPLPIPKALQQQLDTGKRTRWYRRELPYSWDVLLENVTDPAHLPHSHHKLTPAMTRDKAGPMPFKSVAAGGAAAAHAAAAAPAAAEAGGSGGELPMFSFPYAPPVGSFNFPSALSASGVVAFNPPCCVMYEYDLPGGAKFWTLIYATPAGPGRSFVMTTSANSWPAVKQSDVVAALFKNPKAFLPSLMRYKMQYTPTWKVHQISNKLFDMDNVFLHQQDVLLQRRGRGSWAQDYYMPVPCDSLVISMRKWVDTLGGGGPKYAPGAEPMKALAISDLQNRWEQHTRHCTACSAAVKAFEARVERAKLAAAACFAVLCALLGSCGVPALLAGGLPAVAAVAAAAGMAICLRVARAAAATVQSFKYVPFSHQDNH